MNKQEEEIFKKLKEALNYNYLYDSVEFSDDRKEVDNLEDYLKIIKQERELEKEFDNYAIIRSNTYKEFIHYLAHKAIGDKDDIIKCFEHNDDNVFIGYTSVKKMLIDNTIYLEFEVDGTKLRAAWHTNMNYAVWETCGHNGDDYSGYLLFPTYKDNEYFILWYQC